MIAMGKIPAAVCKLSTMGENDLIPYTRRFCAMVLFVGILLNMALPAFATIVPSDVSTYDAPAETVPVQTEGATDTESREPSGQVTSDESEPAVMEEQPSEEPGELEMPMFFQTDYPNDYYGDGTVASNGSSIVSVAMVASFLTQNLYQPDELANWFGRHGYNNIERLEFASDMLQLPYRKAKDIVDVVEELKKGNVAIALMNGNSPFLNDHHYIVMKGITEDGKILINDPYAPNYDDWTLQRGYENGFPQEELTGSFGGGWIYDVNAMSDDPYIYSNPAGQRKIFREHWRTFPHIYQTDYPNNRFGMGTIASSGCAITSLAMVASYMTNHVYDPVDLADWFGGYGANNVDRLEYGSYTLQLPYRKAWNIHEVLDEVRNGNLAILLMNSKSIFSASQHFIVITGMTKTGRFMVADSYKPNYEKWDLQKGFEEGFTEEQLIKGYDGGWIYDFNNMPEDPFIYVEEKPYVEPRYPNIQLTWEEQQLLAKVIWVEARGESAEGQQAIAEIVFNRMISEDFPDSLTEVIFAENQFRSVKFLDDAEPWQAQYDAIDDALEGPYVLPVDVYHFATYPVNDNIWGKIGGHIFCRQWTEKTEDPLPEEMEEQEAAAEPEDAVKSEETVESEETTLAEAATVEEPARTEVPAADETALMEVAEEETVLAEEAEIPEDTAEPEDASKPEDPVKPDELPASDEAETI